MSMGNYLRRMCSLLFERTLGDTSTTGSCWNTVKSSWESVGAVMSLVVTISTRAAGGTIEVWRVERILSRFAPVPVGLSAGESTLILKCLLKRPRVVSVP
jgi:hypothetical protein